MALNMIPGSNVVYVWRLPTAGSWYDTPYAVNAVLDEAGSYSLRAPAPIV